MKKHFYTHLVEIDTIRLELDRLSIQSAEREELIMIIHESLHHVVIDLVLTELTSSDRKLFLSYVMQGCHDEIWILLEQKIEKPEEKMRNAIKSFVIELHRDIEDLQKEASE